MMTLASEVIRLLDGKTLATAESCTGGGIGSALTAVAGSSAVYKGGIISYCNEIKEKLLAVPNTILEQVGAVSRQVALEMAQGARDTLDADVAVSVTGLAGPGGDDFGNPVGTVFIGYADKDGAIAQHFCFQGDRKAVRAQAVDAALKLIIEKNS